MEIKGFSLLLQDFCGYCEDFEPDVEKVSWGEPGKCEINIRCENRNKCSRIAANIVNRLAGVNKNG